MFKATLNIAPLQRKAQDTRAADVALMRLAHDALTIVVPDAITNIVRETPRSAVDHDHLQDQWRMTDHGATGVTIDNDTPYAGYVADEPDIFGSRVAEFHNRALRAALDALPDDIRARLEAVLPGLLRQI